jgi:hypothetical protein
VCGTVRRHRRLLGRQLEAGARPSSTTPGNVPAPVMGLSGAIAIGAGGLHSCALLADKTVACWARTISVSWATGRSASTAASGWSASRPDRHGTNSMSSIHRSNDAGFVRTPITGE